MQVLDKILTDIDAEIEKQKEADGSLVGTSMWNQWVKGMQRAKDIIRGHINDGWIPVEKALPKNNSYILLSFSNFPLADIGRYEKDDEGGAFYPGDEDVSYISHGIFVNAWQSLPQPYDPERKTEDSCKTEEFDGWKEKMFRRFCKCE